MHKQVSSYQLIRYGVGYVFVISALMKLVFADFTSAFAGFGIPYPEMAVLLVGLTELIGGICIICNYYVKKAAIPLLVIIIAAIILAKVPILSSGIFQFAFEVRLEILMVLLLYILWKH